MIWSLICPILLCCWLSGRFQARCELHANAQLCTNAFSRGSSASSEAACDADPAQPLPLKLCRYLEQEAFTAPNRQTYKQGMEPTKMSLLSSQLYRDPVSTATPPQRTLGKSGWVVESLPSAVKQICIQNLAALHASCDLRQAFNLSRGLSFILVKTGS